MGALWAVLAQLAAGVLAFLGKEATKAVVIKGFVMAVALMVFPVLIWNVIHDLIAMAYSSVSSHTGASGMQPAVAQFTGLTAWLFDRFRIPESLGLYLSAVAFKFTLGLIPFVRV